MLTHTHSLRVLCPIFVRAFWHLSKEPMAVMARMYPRSSAGVGRGVIITITTEILSSTSTGTHT